MGNSSGYVYGPFIPFTSGTVGSWSGRGRIIKKKEAREWDKWLSDPPGLDAPTGKIYWLDFFNPNEGSD
jgi:hypothetical protein